MGWQVGVAVGMLLPKSCLRRYFIYGPPLAMPLAALSALSSLQQTLASMRCAVAGTTYGGGQQATAGATAWHQFAEAYNRAQVNNCDLVIPGSGRGHEYCIGLDMG